MDSRSPYYKQVQLLIRVLPMVAKEDCFALKGGTAINLFVHDFPRLSVDIDLAYLPLEPRDEALGNARAALARISKRIQSEPDLSAALQNNNPDELRIIVNAEGAQIKIEVSPVARGTLHAPAVCDVVEAVENDFGFASIQVVSLADLYGGKLCAALDRQHPRDIFDVKMLLDSQTLDRDLFVGFIAYLLSHSRPIAEILHPRWKNISLTYENEFKGMTIKSVTLDELNDVREKMILALKANFTQQDYDFLRSFKTGSPDWSLSPNEQIQHLPAVQWKLINIKRMSKQKHLDALHKLEKAMIDWI